MRIANRTWLLLAVLLLVLVPGMAEANPTISQEELIAGWRSVAKLVLFALTVLLFEAAVVVAILLCFHIYSPPLIIAVYAANLMVYLVVFIPVYFGTRSVLLSEAVIVGMDCAAVKLLACMPVFQTEDFKGLKWRFAFMVVCIGNLVSYSLGYLR